jgi:hypothetical protein
MCAYLVYLIVVIDTWYLPVYVHQILGKSLHNYVLEYSS